MMTPRSTNGLAIAAMVVSIAGVALICAWGPLSIFVSPIGAVLGHIAYRKVKRERQRGEGMALTGILVGWAGVVLSLLFIVGMIVYLKWGEGELGGILNL